MLLFALRIVADPHRQVGARRAVGVVAAVVDGRVGHRRAAGVADALLAGDREAGAGDVDALLGAGAPAVVHHHVAAADRGRAVLLADLGVGLRRTGDDEGGDRAGGEDAGRRDGADGTSHDCSLDGDPGGGLSVGALPCNVQHIDEGEQLDSDAAGAGPHACRPNCDMRKGAICTDSERRDRMNAVGIFSGTERRVRIVVTE